jgi:hypothetical protein
MQLDADYLQLVSQALGHSAKAVQMVGLNTLKEIAEDPLLSGRTCRRGCRSWPNASPARTILATEVIHRRTPSTIPKKGLRAFFGMLNDPSSDSEAGRNPRQTALFGIRSRPVQYVVVVLMKYVLPRRRARWAICNGPSASRN